MMGCLGVWVTDAIEPEDLGNYVATTYSTAGAKSIGVRTTDTIIIDWASENVKSYPVMVDATHITYSTVGVGDVKIYNPEYLKRLDVGGDCSNIDGFQYLSNVEELSIYTAQSDIVIPDGLNAIETIEINGSTTLKTLTLQVGNPTLATLYLIGYNFDILNTVTIPSDLVNLSWFVIDHCPLLTTITIPSELIGLKTLQINGAGLTEAAVNQILITLDTNGSSPTNVDLSGGTSAAPTGLGAAAKTSLEGKGVTVTTN